jgi:hypothetical protein
VLVTPHAAGDEDEAAGANHVDEVADGLGHARHPDLFPMSGGGHRRFLLSWGNYFDWLALLGDYSPAEPGGQDASIWIAT